MAKFSLFDVFFFSGMTVFEARRLVEVYNESQESTAEMTSDNNAPNRQNQASVKKDKSLGWIPNPRNDMSRFYNEVYESFYLERVGYFGGNKKAFKKAFHEEARREYDNEKAVKKLESN